MPAKKAQARLKVALQPMRHLWHGVEADLVHLGIHSLEELRDRDPEELYQSYCAEQGQAFDLCVRDIFVSLVEFAKTGEPRAWWRFTRERSFPQPTKRAQRHALENV